MQRSGTLQSPAVEPRDHKADQNKGGKTRSEETGCNKQPMKKHGGGKAPSSSSSSSSDLLVDKSFMGFLFNVSG